MPWPYYSRDLCHEVAWSTALNNFVRCDRPAFLHGFDSIGLPLDGLHTHGALSWLTPGYMPTKKDMMAEFHARRAAALDASEDPRALATP